MENNGALQYFNEHITCRSYLAKENRGITYVELEPGMDMELGAPANHLLIFMEGSCVIDCNQFKHRTFSGGQMVLVPMSASFSGKASERLRFLDISFETPVNSCDKMVLQSYSHIVPKITYDFRPMPLRKPLPEFCSMLAYCLGNGMYCEHFLDLKHKELFFYLRGFYSKSEITELLYPIVNRSMEFKSFIYQNYEKVNTLDELITLSNMSKRTFFRKFKSEFNMTAYQWKLKQTCRLIVDELSRHGAQPKDVAERLGFDSASNFCNFCKRNIGYSPTELMSLRGDEQVLLEEVSYAV